MPDLATLERKLIWRGNFILPAPYTAPDETAAVKRTSRHHNALDRKEILIKGGGLFFNKPPPRSASIPYATLVQ